MNSVPYLAAVSVCRGGDDLTSLQRCECTVVISFGKCRPPYTTCAFKIYETACVTCRGTANQRGAV